MLQNIHVVDTLRSDDLHFSFLLLMQNVCGITIQEFYLP